MGGSVTVLPEFLEFYLLLYAVYSRQCFHFEINAFPSTCNLTAWIWNVTIYTAEPGSLLLQLTSLSETLGGFLPEQVLFNKEVGVQYFYN
jgi:hypothetical protein